MTKTATKEHLRTWEDVDRALLALARAETTLSRLESDRDEAISNAREAYKESAESHSDNAKELREQIAEFMLSHEAELGDKRSKRLEHGMLFLRRTPPKIATMSRVTWQRVLEVALTLPKRVRDRIVETTQALKKGELKQMLQADELKEEYRKALGVRIDQGDEVYYELA